MADPQKVEFRTQDGEVETLWAESVGANRFRIDNSPFYAYSVSWLDVVETDSEAQGFPVFRRVVSKSGHRTVRVIVDGAEQLQQLDALVAAFGCSYEGAYSRLISVDVPPESDLMAVRQALIKSGLEWEHADPTYAELFGT
jgi:hypothetical protein